MKQRAITNPNMVALDLILSLWLTFVALTTGNIAWILVIAYLWLFVSTDQHLKQVREWWLESADMNKRLRGIVGYYYEATDLYDKEITKAERKIKRLENKIKKLEGAK